jgi:threonine dehydrogenase-like Zn-dependent dehydrogenase
MPKQLVAVAPRTTAVLTYEDRELKPGEMRVKVDFASPKHGTELAAFRGESPHIADYYDSDWHAFLPRQGSADDPFNGKWVLGNQFVGTVVEACGEVGDFNIGERVCGYGGIAETRITSPGGLRKMPANMSWQNAVCYDPAQFALGGVRDGGVKLGDAVAVIGLGAIGQVAAQLARLAGASYVAVVDPIEKRRTCALAAGADAAFDPTTQDAGLEFKRATGKRGVDVIIETSANEAALQVALRGLAFGGTIAFVGWARPFRGGLDLGREAHFNNANIVFSRAVSEPLREYPRWTFERICDSCWQILSDGRIDCENIIDPVVPFADAAGAYEEYVDRHPDRSIKLGFAFK